MMRRCRGTSTASEAASVAMNPATPSQLSTLADPSSTVRAKPTPEAMAATRSAGCTLSVRRMVAEKS